MLRRFALLLLILASMTPTAVSAKAVVERAREIYDEELPVEDTVQTDSQEITEVVTEEVTDLEPVQDEPRRDECADQIDFLGHKKPNNFPSEWAAFWRMSAYNPKSNQPSGGSIMNNLGLRYKVPDRWGEYFQLAYELSYNFWDGGTADIEHIEFAIEAFACESPLFRMKHHPYYGIGFGNASIDRVAAPDYNVNTWSVFGGIEFPGRRVDWDVFAKYIFAPVNDDTGQNYDVDDLQLGVGIIYTFGRGR